MTFFLPILFCLMLFLSLVSHQVAAACTVYQLLQLLFQSYLTPLQKTSPAWKCCSDGSQIALTATLPYTFSWL